MGPQSPPNLGSVNLKVVMFDDSLSKPCEVKGGSVIEALNEIQC